MLFNRGKSIDKVDMIGTNYKLTEFIAEDDYDTIIVCIELNGKIFPVRYNYFEDIEFLDKFLDDECIFDYCKFDLAYCVQNYL